MSESERDDLWARSPVWMRMSEETEGEKCRWERSERSERCVPWMSPVQSQ